MLEETVFGNKGIPIASERINYLQQLTLSQSIILWMETSTEDMVIGSIAFLI
jgi:hypothetical protein